jgi:hypothetical protein
MKEFSCKSNIGVGLFSTDPIEIVINFPNGDRGVFQVRPLTQDLVVSLLQQGVKFDGVSDPKKAIENNTAILREIIVGGSIGDLVIDEDNVGRIASHSGLSAALMNAARELAEETAEVEEGNFAS